MTIESELEATVGKQLRDAGLKYVNARVVGAAHAT
jgi:hypothetical protein